ncbi:MAG TPA: DUF445 domain-containing protein [Sphingomicrobium sp.]|jgi:uncharacterized membrane-anchored protein YjiN (DUF445 family)|nr:DUF445 domain-containing protein [Sphingomicrobium sp.]
MKVVATGLLVAMGILYFLTHEFEQDYPWVGFVNAFAEAAMVGALADWFAVTALFRHPLGLPIPHTAIIPRNKDRIGESLASFLKENFLISSVVARRMRGIDVAGAVGRFLRTPEGEGSRIRQGASRLIADIFEGLDDERLGGIVKGAVSSRIREIDVAPLLGHALASAINEDRHVPMLEAAIRWMARTLDANESMIREMVHKRASWVLKLAGLDAKLADAIVDGLRKLTVEMATDPAHPVRAKIEEELAKLANDLQTNPATQSKVEEMKEALLDNPSVALWFDTLWERAREAIIRAARDPDAAMAGKLGEVLRSMGGTLESDPRIRGAINQFARRAVAGMASSYGGSIVKLVSETVRGWDARTVTNRLEAAVGRDLQYIRINGTLVGGLVGVTLHTIHYF